LLILTGIPERIPQFVLSFFGFKHPVVTRYYTVEYDTSANRTKEDSGSRTSDLAISDIRVKPLSQAPAGSQPRAPKANIYQYIEQAYYSNDLERLFEATRSAAAGAARAATHCGGPGSERRAGVKRTKNGQSSRADGGSMGPNALDRENGAVQSSVRSRHISRGRCCVRLLWQCRQNSGLLVHRTPLRGGWNCPRSLVLPVCRGLLG
jgi:hypothetical protein